MAQLTKTLEINGKVYQLTPGAAKAVEEAITPFEAAAVPVVTASADVTKSEPEPVGRKRFKKH